ncbi:hypothetical protein ASAC_1500 [Acidilobus saccharovorans 345-15]|uniref:Tubulin like n=1 Tax=Acidilobus saccharovorans (strain DSM 16705 / JCM 18335 / VKM B-2471 / 345-15) TaxID=666510 RepID=D9PZB8_ACIS3|nr:tubulin-like doman-containing protein [Acidilobus saccharovorans]ADL19905.1 hypothetical protein ASAC_1500 [Acidilobus saccharovorans 345-15]
MGSLLVPVLFSYAGIISIGLAALEFVALWMLTGKIITKESGISVINIAYTVAWSVLTLLGVAIYSFMSPGLAALPTVLLYAIYSVLLGISVVLLIVPLAMFYGKYRQYQSLANRYNNIKLRSDKALADASSLSGKLKRIRDDISSTEALIAKARQLKDIADRNPDVIIKGVNERPTMPEFSIPKVNYVIVGIGGGGSALLESYIEYLRSQGAIKDEPTNPFLFVFFDLNSSNAERLRKQYEGTEVAPKLYVFNHYEAMTPDSIRFTNPWISGLYQESEIPVQAAGNLRFAGLAAYSAIRSAFIDEVKHRLESLKSATGYSGTMIVVLTSLGGGTGSGSFLKITMDLKKAVKDLTGVDPIVAGVGVVPKEDESAVNHANAYAAIKELVYLLKHGSSQGMNYPFDFFFLVSREKPVRNVDLMIGLALSRFLFDLGTSGAPRKGEGKGVEQGTAFAHTFDLEDLRTYLQPIDLLTFSRYEIYFPASKLSWLKLVGEPVLGEVESREKGIRDSLSEAEASLNALKSDVSGILNDIDALYRDMQSALMYPSFERRKQDMMKDMLSIKSNLSTGTITVTSLEGDYKRLMSQSEPLGYPELSRQVSEFRAAVSDTISFLRSPPISSIEYVFPVKSPDDIDVGQLQTANLYGMITRLGLQDAFKSALTNLSGTLAGVGQTMANLNYDLIKAPIGSTSPFMEFVRKYNPDLAREGVVYTPPIRNILQLVTTAPENVSTADFPTEKTITLALQSKASNPAFRLGYVPAKKFSISSYRIIHGIYLWSIAGSGDYVFTDISYLKRSYEQLKLQKNIGLHHALFYGDFKDFEDLTGVRVSGMSPAEGVKRIVDFWSSYDPELDYIDMWGVLRLAFVYEGLAKIRNAFDNYMKEVSGAIEMLSKGGTAVPIEKIGRLAEDIASLEVPKVKADIDKIAEANRVARSEVIDRALMGIKETVSDVYNVLSSASNSLEATLTKLSEVEASKKGDYFALRELQELRNSIITVQRKASEMAEEFISAYG